MCGFAGIVTWDERYRVSPETLRAMSACIAHRGPDGEGLWINHDREITPEHPQVAMAHRRLAVIDPDPRANQPFSDERGRWIVFNGEIYNFRELRAELSKVGPDYLWRTNCDTEVLLVAYDVWGERCVERFNGMYAFVIWDETTGSVFLARDRMGQKPLYVARSNDGRAIAFASELSGICRLDWVDREIDAAALGDYLRWGYVPSPHTIYRGVEKLPPATWWRLSRGEDRLESYFDPNQSTYPPEELADDDSAVPLTRQLVERAVRRQLVSDVPLGCFLSGGIDSSVMALAMSGAGQTVETFSIGFDDPRYDETRYARAVAEHLKTKHRQLIVRPDAAGDLPKLAGAYGEPFADSSALPTYYLSRETRQHVKVAISGDGGDELFGGYDRYRAVAVGDLLSRTPAPIRALVSSRWWLKLPGTHPKSKIARWKRFIRSLDLPERHRYASYVRLFDQPLIDQLLLRNVAAATSDFDVAALYESFRSAGREPAPSAAAADRVSYLPEDLLTKVDRASMLHALEVRSPFMDHELVAFAAGLPQRQLLMGRGKRLLREAFRDRLPEIVFKRRKMGFAVPIGEWFRADLRSMLRDHLFASDSFATHHLDLPTVERLINEHEQERVDHSQRLYALLMLELWWRQHHQDNRE